MIASSAQSSTQSHLLSPLSILKMKHFSLCFITSTLIINLLSTLYLITFNSHKTSGGKLYPHFVDYESEACTGVVNWPRSRSWYAGEPEFKPKVMNSAFFFFPTSYGLFSFNFLFSCNFRFKEKLQEKSLPYIFLYILPDCPDVTLHCKLHLYHCFPKNQDRVWHTVRVLYKFGA